MQLVLVLIDFSILTLIILLCISFKSMFSLLYFSSVILKIEIRGTYSRHLRVCPGSATCRGGKYNLHLVRRKSSPNRKIFRLKV